MPDGWNESQAETDPQAIRLAEAIRFIDDGIAVLGEQMGAEGKLQGLRYGPRLAELGADAVKIRNALVRLRVDIAYSNHLYAGGPPQPVREFGRVEQAG